jgi:anti-sigma regulatory factor (Ser/Thr protein kinase)
VEVTAMKTSVAGSSCHAAFDVLESSRVGEVRRHAVQLAESLGFDEVATGRVAIVATELANNLVRHAREGRMLVGAVHDPEGGEPLVELMSLDRGPGIANVAASLVDGHSTGGTSGTGLGAVRRLSRVFDVYSSVPAGTVILARLAPTAAPEGRGTGASPYAVGVVRLAAPGELVCGDNWQVHQQAGRVSVFLADGLGHGPLAQEAADAAVAVAADHEGRAPSEVLDLVHQALRSTRGAAVAMASIDLEAATLQFAGVGNVAGRIVSGVVDRSLMSQHGTAGLQQSRRVRDVAYELPPHALVLLHSDGLTSRWKFDQEPGLLQHHPGVIAGWLVREQLRGRDDATVVILKRQDS